MSIPQSDFATVTPREMIASYYSHLASREGILPISGGWGLSKECACIIDKYDPVATPGLAFDAWKAIDTFVKTSLYLELIVFRAEGDKYNQIRWTLTGRETLEENGRTYEHQVYEVSAFHDRDWDSLKAEWEAHDGFGSEEFDLENHMQRRTEAMVTTYPEFWFDVTSCVKQSLFGANLPWVIGRLARRDITDYEAQQPGQGYSVAYNALPGYQGYATVYFYSNGEEFIPDDPEEESFVDYFRRVVGMVIEDRKRSGQSCEFVGAGPVRRTEGIADYLAAELDLNSDDCGHERSYLLLRSYRGQYLKLRITVPADDQYKALPMEFAFDLLDAIEIA